MDNDAELIAIADGEREIEYDTDGLWRYVMIDGVLQVEVLN
jgi:hypothetical protein